jgi:predicted nucleotidyltransferase
MVKKITKIEIIKLFLTDYSKRYYLREIARLLEKPHQSVKPYLEQLVKEKILIKEVRKKIVEHRLSMKNNIVYNYLIIAEKENLLERLNKDSLFNILYEKLSKYFTSNTFIIFGSASVELKKGSDIDLLIIGKTNLSKELKDFEEVYNKKIHIIQIDNLKNADISFIKEIYKKHLILNNTETIINFFGGLYEKNQLV